MCHASSWAHPRHGSRFRHRHEPGHRDPAIGEFDPWAHFAHGDATAGGFGVRRPLRFLAHKLELDEKQVAALAKILDELKIERAQGEVDDRRALADFADAVGAEAFDSAKANAAGDRRVESSGRLRDAVAKSLQQIHAILNPDQRAKLAYLIRTGVLVM
jgi:Spy/CpxP family protein refolding chaperone